jgi:hypothetical protein
VLQRLCADILLTSLRIDSGKYSLQRFGSASMKHEKVNKIPMSFRRRTSFPFAGLARRVLIWTVLNTSIHSTLLPALLRCTQTRKSCLACRQKLSNVPGPSKPTISTSPRSTLETSRMTSVVQLAVISTLVSARGAK